MGVGASVERPDAILREKAIMERLQSLRVSEQVEQGEDDFVHIGTEKTLADRLAARSPEGLALQLTEEWQSFVMKDPKNRLALAALSEADPNNILASRSAHIADQHVFNVQIPFEGGPITNQRSSGRCWLFASTNVFRVALMKRYGLDSFELSQAYLFFWDKLEKANFFLETIIDTAADEDLEGRLVQTLLQEPISDGGQWDMVYNLVEKYGLVPQAVYPDSWNAKNSRALNYIVIAKLREYALTLRRMLRSTSVSEGNLAKTKDSMMREIHLILTLTLGPPPCPTEPFRWDYTDRAGKAHTLTTKTPLDFSRDLYSATSSSSSTLSYLGGSGGAGELTTTTFSTVSRMISLVHDPRHEPLTLMTVSRLGNVVGGRPVTYVNVDMITLKRACEDMLRAGQPVFFGSDVGKFSDRIAGIMDTGIVDYELGFNVGVGMGLSKADRLRVGESQMTHAMVLTAVHVEEEASGKKNTSGKSRYSRWRVQNSWGEDAGNKGWFVMSDAWMDEWVYQAVVDPRFLDGKVKKVLDKEPVVLPLWDPMGSLA